MKKVILSVLLLGIIMGLQAQELKVINLNKPNKSRNVTLMQALDKRHSERAFANKQLTHQDLSDLLWRRHSAGHFARWLCGHHH